MNPVLLLTRNCLELTKRCVKSIEAQDVKTAIFAIDNGSTDGTREWLNSEEFPGIYKENQDNDGVSAGWNWGLDYIFGKKTKGRHHFQGNHCLVLNNDTVIPPWFYRELLSYQFRDMDTRPPMTEKIALVTGVAVDHTVTEPSPKMPLNPHPDFSAFLIRRYCWEMVGQFDERMKIYCSDCDYHIRAHRLGVGLWKANVPYYHVNSQTLKRADAADREEIMRQAQKDREVFQSIYGCLPGTKEYEELFKDAKS